MSEYSNRKYYDALIDGNNEVWIKDHFSQWANTSYALMVLNIKNFRYYNETYGILGGDEILNLIYHQMNHALQDYESIAHVYGDTFVFILQYTSMETLVEEKMMYLLDQVLYRIKDERIYRNIFASCGIYVLDEKSNYEEAFNRANIARLQSSQLQERAFCYEVFDHHLYRAYMEKMALEIRTAQAYKDYEFIPYIQPKVDSKTHEIIGGEALLRWIDENDTEVPLQEFLPILTENAYITLVDIDIFDLVCQWLHDRIQKNKAVVPISFNICKPNFYDENLINNYMDVFNKYTIPKSMISFEMMESMDDMDKMKEVIHAFKEEGFSCSLDDFGSGYSSFNVLLNAELDEVKLDRQFFLKNLNGDNREIISTIVRLIKSLHMKTVAEGVETQEYADFLALCGCDAIQGFYFYRPMSLQSFAELLGF